MIHLCLDIIVGFAFVGGELLNGGSIDVSLFQGSFGVIARRVDALKDVFEMWCYGGDGLHLSV